MDNQIVTRTGMMLTDREARSSIIRLLTDTISGLEIQKTNIEEIRVILDGIEDCLSLIYV